MNIYVVSCVCPSGWQLSISPSILHSKNFKGYMLCAYFYIKFFHTCDAYTIGITDFCHSFTFVSYLYLSRGQQNKTFWLHLLVHFSTEWDDICCHDVTVPVEQFVCCLTSQQMLVYLKDGSAKTILLAATLRQKQQIKLSISPSHSILTPVVSWNFNGLWLNLMCCWDLLVLWTSFLFYVVWSIFKGENSVYVISLRKKNNVGMHLDIYRQISFKPSMMTEATKLHYLIPGWMTLAFIEGHNNMRKQKLLHSFSSKFLCQFG